MSRHDDTQRDIAEGGRAVRGDSAMSFRLLLVEALIDEGVDKPGSAR